MIQEYLFSGKNHRKEVEQYTYKSVKVETYGIEYSDCWIAMFSLDGENSNNAKTLSAVNDYVVTNFHPTVLSNGCSAYYNKALYPHFNEFERKLRKLLYLKSALSKNTNDTEVIKDLEKKDLGEIFTLLFSDAQFVKDVKKTVNDKTWQFTKIEILTALQQITENTLWDHLIGDGAVPLLRSDFAQVQSFRNDIMHAHSMGTESYNSALKLIEKINEQLDVEIGKIIVDKESAPQSVHNKDFNSALGDAIREMDYARQKEYLTKELTTLQSAIAAFNHDGVREALEEYRRIAISPELTSISKFISSSEYSQIQREMEEISKMKKDAPLIVQELQEIAEFMGQHKIELPSALLELQKSLQHFENDLSLDEPRESQKELADDGVDKPDESHEV